MNVYSNGINKYYKKPNDNTGQVVPNKFNSGQVLPAKCVIKKNLFFRAFAFFNCIEPCDFNLKIFNEFLKYAKSCSRTS